MGKAEEVMGMVMGTPKYCSNSRSGSCSKSHRCRHTRRQSRQKRGTQSIGLNLRLGKGTSL